MVHYKWNIFNFFNRYAAAGGITGALYKFKQGPRATIAGGIIGSALGSIAGCVSVGLMYLTGMFMRNILANLFDKPENTPRCELNHTYKPVCVNKNVFYSLQELPWKTYDTGNTNGRKNIRKRN